MTDEDNTMEQDELEKILKSHREWLLGITGGRRADLTSVTLTHADLRNADLTHVNFTNANLTNADFTHADLKNVDFTSADLRDSILKYVDFTNANLTNVDLRGADLDFASWPLWCGSLKVKVDSRIAKQLMYHALAVLPAEDMDEFLADPVKYANGFHRVISGNLEKIT